MDNKTNRRKIEHISILQKDPAVDRKANYFDQIQLMHRALPEINLADVDPSTTFLGKRIAFPLIISSMTGGDHALLKKINQNLAIAAEATHVALAVGSQRIMFENTNAIESFDLRSFAPTIPLISNIGAVQLNYNIELSHCCQAVDILSADGLYFHLNPLQEVIQPEGDTDFSHLLNKISAINNAINVPVLIKEVGCGIGPTDIEMLLGEGIKYIDLAGQGGTSWSRIEFHRDASELSQGLAFQDWGIPTPIALKLARPYNDKAFIIASGGLRGGLDMIKSVILGASLCGMAAPLLKAAMQSPDQVIKEIESLKQAFVTAMFLLGAPDVNYLHGNSQLLLETFY